MKPTSHPDMGSNENAFAFKYNSNTFNKHFITKFQTEKYLYLLLRKNRNLSNTLHRLTATIYPVIT